MMISWSDKPRMDLTNSYAIDKDDSVVPLGLIAATIAHVLSNDL